MPLFAEPPPTSDLVRYVIAAIDGGWVNGTAAVIVFFVVSGFCIHYPYATGKPFDLGEFLVRRFVRVGLPLLAIVAMLLLAGLPLALLDRTVMWSLVCELIYYAAYPMLRRLAARVQWRYVFAAAFVVGYAVVLTDPSLASADPVRKGAGNYPSYGVGGNALLGLPCWLVGVLLAEWKARGDAPVSRMGVWGWRLTIWALSCALLALRFHTPVGHPWTLNFFALAVYCWLQQELLHYRNARPWAWLEAAGTWSYSVYVVHAIALWAFVLAMGPLAPGDRIAWIELMGFIALASYAFYLVVERPSHQLARALARWPARRESNPRPTA